MPINANAIIAQGNVDELVKTAEALGSELARSLTTSQIRTIFGEVRRIEMNWTDDAERGQAAYRSVVMLQPKLAYQAKRERGAGVSTLRDALDPCINEIRKAPEAKRRLYFGHFVDFFEAILAYHKAAGGN
jgi:CRISPR-associated protein Csm2